MNIEPEVRHESIGRFLTEAQSHGEHGRDLVTTVWISPDPVDSKLSP